MSEIPEGEYVANWRWDFEYWLSDLYFRDPLAFIQILNNEEMWFYNPIAEAPQVVAMTEWKEPLAPQCALGYGNGKTDICWERRYNTLVGWTPASAAQVADSQHKFIWRWEDNPPAPGPITDEQFFNLRRVNSPGVKVGFGKLRQCDDEVNKGCCYLNLVTSLRLVRVQPFPSEDRISFLDPLEPSIVMNLSFAPYYTNQFNRCSAHHHGNIQTGVRDWMQGGTVIKPSTQLIQQFLFTHPKYIRDCCMERVPRSLTETICGSFQYSDNPEADGRRDCDLFMENEWCNPKDAEGNLDAEALAERTVECACFPWVPPDDPENPDIGQILYDDLQTQFPDDNDTSKKCIVPACADGFAYMTGHQENASCGTFCGNIQTLVTEGDYTIIDNNGNQSLNCGNEQSGGEPILFPEEPGGPLPCETDTVTCTDGEVLERVGPDCEFPPCAPGHCIDDPQTCDDEEKTIVGRDPENNCEFKLCPEGSCPDDTRGCTDGTRQTRDPALGCNFPACPPGSCPDDQRLCPDGTLQDRDPDADCLFSTPCPVVCDPAVLVCDDGTEVKANADCSFPRCPGEGLGLPEILWIVAGVLLLMILVGVGLGTKKGTTKKHKGLKGLKGLWALLLLPVALAGVGIYFYFAPVDDDDDDSQAVQTVRPRRGRSTSTSTRTSSSDPLDSEDLRADERYNFPFETAMELWFNPDISTLASVYANQMPITVFTQDSTEPFGYRSSYWAANLNINEPIQNCPPPGVGWENGVCEPATS